MGLIIKHIDIILLFAIVIEEADFPLQMTTIFRTQMYILVYFDFV